MKLSKRLKALLQEINSPVLADIGCDHGYLCAAALLENRVGKAYACDIADGPLAQAQITCQENGLQEKMMIRKQDGLNHLPEDVTLVTIAGMGGSLIETMLRNWISDQKLKTDEEKDSLDYPLFLLSPHKDAPELRSFLIQNGFHILNEDVVHDQHYYPLMKVKYDPQSVSQKLSDDELICGVSLLGRQDVLDYLNHSIAKWSRILSGLPDNKKENASRILSSYQIVLNKLSKLNK